MDVHAMHSAYGNYAPANVFANNDNVGELADTEAPIYNAAFESDPGAKRHAACDECRKRKLRCSGELAGCSRCIKQSLTCHYSKQAVMGRPRKRRKTSEGAEQVEPPLPQLPVEPSIQPIVPDFTRADDRAEFEGLCPGPLIQYIKSRTPAPPPPFVTQGSLYEHPGCFMVNGSDGTPPTESPTTPVLSQHKVAEAYHKDVANWPDFSTMTMLPQIVQDNHPDPSSSSGQPRSVDEMGSIPACACLPNVYLTLSSLSTLVSFPISVHTIESLQTAHRTAQSCLYCSICPTKFQSGMQNVMMTGMLLTILADSWHRVRKATAEELRSGFSPPEGSSMVAKPLTDDQKSAWRIFAHQLLRTNVFGDKVSPCPPCGQSPTEFSPESNTSAEQGIKQCHYLASINSSTSTPTLQALIDAMERRQSCWHGKIPDNGEFPKRMSEAEMQAHMAPEHFRESEMDESGHLCLNIVSRARSVLQTLDKSELTL